jgi:hypothetical protein
MTISISIPYTNSPKKALNKLKRKIVKAFPAADVSILCSPFNSKTSIIMSDCTKDQVDLVSDIIDGVIKTKSK